MASEEEKHKRAAYMRKWRAEHPEYADYQKRYRKQYYAENADTIKARAKKWRDDNAETLKESKKAYHKRTYKYKGRPIGEKHHLWKGDSVSYYALHRWVARHLGTPQKCEHCGTTEKRRYNWANLSGEYKRDLFDWVRLCVPCHRIYDHKRHGRSMPYGIKELNT